jgi:DNA-binding NarL/FixJ family response regulator
LGLAPAAYTRHVAALKVFIAEDSPSILNALKTLIQPVPEVQIVGNAERAGQAIELIETLQPGVAVLDISLAEGTGLDVLKRIKRTLPGVIAIILTSYDGRWIRAKCKEAGADHFLNKSADFDKIPNLLRQIAGENGLSGS